jgi:hypothetical protein
VTRDDVGDDGAGGDRRAAGQDEESVDELVEPSVDLRTAQEKEAASDSEDSVGTAGAADDELDELAEPVTDLRTVQEQERQATDADVDGHAADADQEEGECDE